MTAAAGSGGRLRQLGMTAAMMSGGNWAAQAASGQPPALD